MKKFACYNSELLGRVRTKAASTLLRTQGRVEVFKRSAGRCEKLVLERARFEATFSVSASLSTSYHTHAA